MESRLKSANRIESRKYTFPKSLRLCHKQELETLFAQGTKNLVYPILAQVLPVGDSEFPVRVVIMVSKRRFARAVDRNLLKRRIREAFRLKRHLIQSPSSIHLSLSFVGKEIESYQKIASALDKIIHQINSLPAE